MRPFSINTTGTPNAAAAAATERPPAPAPITHRSGRSSSMMNADRGWCAHGSVRFTARAARCLHVLDHHREEGEQAEDDECNHDTRRRQRVNVEVKPAIRVTGG